MGACCQSRRTASRSREPTRAADMVAAAGADRTRANLAAAGPVSAVSSSTSDWRQQQQQCWPVLGSLRRLRRTSGPSAGSAAGRPGGQYRRSTSGEPRPRPAPAEGGTAAPQTGPVTGPGQELRRSLRSSSRRRRAEAGPQEDGGCELKLTSSGFPELANSDFTDAGCYSDSRDSGDSQNSRKDSCDSQDSWDSQEDSLDSQDSGIQEDGGAEEAGWTVRDGAGRRHAVLPMDPTELRGHCRALDSGAVRVGAGRYTVPRHGLLSLPSYSAPRTVRPGELVVCSVPKSGTTWTLEMAWLIANDCDFAGARTPLDQNRYTEVGNLFYLGLTPAFLREYVPLVMTRLRKLAGLVHLLYMMLRSLWHSAGLVKTHVPLSLMAPDLLDTNKVIYVTRNPKDALVSYYHHFSRCRVVKYSGTLEDMAEDYMAGRLPGLPFFSHVLEAWRQRHHPNMLFLFYEDMKRDMPGTLRRVAAFLGKTLTEDQVGKLCRHLDFAHMKENEHANSLMYQAAGILEMPSFIREGQVGNWRRHVSEETDRRLNDWIKRSVAGTGLSYEGVQ